MSYNIYFIACALMIIIGALMLVTGRYLWSLPFFGGAAACFFIGMSQEHADDDSRGDGY
ncbi:MAG: hypothetical protein R3D89_09165 [Sphingomonadaceae bacterium]